MGWSLGRGIGQVLGSALVPAGALLLVGVVGVLGRVKRGADTLDRL